MMLEQAIREQDWDRIPELIEQFLIDTPNISVEQTMLSGSLTQTPQQKADYLVQQGLKLLKMNYFLYALWCFEPALMLSQRASQRALLHGWLAEIHSHPSSSLREANFQAAQWHAEQSFQLHDQLSSQALITRKALSYSLYGANPVYCENMVLNAQLRADIYPDWEMLVYHDDSVPQSVLTRLADLGVQLIDVHTIQAAHLKGTFWRFLALEREEYDAIIMRDADSLISERERLLVQAWLDSGKPFHIMRDWYSHTDLILAGLWGARYGLLRPIRQWIERYIQETPQLHPTHADQLFLKQYIWHRVKHACVHHSSVFHVPEGQWLPELPKINIIDNQRIQLGSWQTQPYPCVIASNHTINHAQIYNEHNQLVCEYPIPDDGQLELPSEYCRRIQAKEWRIHFIQQLILTPS